MTEPSTPSGAGLDHGEASRRLATLVSELAGEAALDGSPAARSGEDRPSSGSDRGWASGRAGRLVERWIPGGTRGVEQVRSAAGRSPRWMIAGVLTAVVAAIATAIWASSQRPAVESAPALPVALSTPSTADRPDARIVVSVVGKVISPGLVELASGARVADAVRAAGGAQPGVDLIALNMARRVSDGEQIYVGIPVPPGVVADSMTDGSSDVAPAGPDAAGATSAARGHSGKAKKGKKASGTGRIDLNRASVDQLEQLPGVGPATAQRIVTWRGQHGGFTSVDQLREVGGIGAAKYAALRELVSI